MLRQVVQVREERGTVNPIPVQDLLQFFAKLVLHNCMADLRRFERFSRIAVYREHTDLRSYPPGYVRRNELSESVVLPRILVIFGIN